MSSLLIQTKNKKVTVKNIELTPLDPFKFLKVVEHFNKAYISLIIKFNKKAHPKGDRLAEHRFLHGQHQIDFYLAECEQEESWASGSKKNYDKLNAHDLTCKLLALLLHELTHALQKERDPHGYRYMKLGKGTGIKQDKLKYTLDPWESEAEGYALMNFTEALSLYQNAV